MQNWLYLTKIQTRKSLLLSFSRWLCLIHEQFDMYLRHVKRLVICKCQCFCLFNIQKWSVFFKYHLLCHRSFPDKRFSDSGRPQDTNLKIYYKTYYCCVVFWILLNHYGNIFSLSSANVCIKY